MPSATARPRLWSAGPGLIAGALTLSFLAAGLITDRFDAAHPAPAQLAYVMDADTGQARWVSSDDSPGEWVSQYLTGPDDLGSDFALFGDGVSTGPAQPADLPPPMVTVVSQSPTASGRSLTLDLTSLRDARLIYLELPDATVLAATVDGREVPINEVDNQFGVVFFALPPGGIRVEVELQEAGPTRIRVMDGTDGLDGLPGYTPRPAGVGIQGSHTSELVVVAKEYTG